MQIYYYLGALISRLSIMDTAIFSLAKTITMVGSRDILTHQRNVLLELGKYCSDKGCSFRSGLAGGSDLASFIGFKHGNEYNPDLASNYVVKYKYFYDDYADSTIKPLKQFSTKLVERATELALEARGTFAGLDDWGIQLHTRNAFQILGDDLESPSDGIILCSEPIGKSEDYQKVKGGTNTAFRIAKKFNIPHLNVATKEGYSAAKLLTSNHPLDNNVLQQMIFEYEDVTEKYYQRRG